LREDQEEEAAPTFPQKEDLRLEDAAIRLLGYRHWR
jgi:hypothetical protein